MAEAHGDPAAGDELAPAHQTCSALTFVPISLRATEPMSMTPSPPTSSVIRSHSSGNFCMYSTVESASYSWRGIRPFSPSVARVPSTSQMFQPK